ncbi:MAG: anti-sigma factor family protein [Actinomycetota bacterium]
MTCDEVRELLPEHLLGSLEGPEDLEVRRHLRGCGGCRVEMTGLADGVASFALAAHDRTPPPDLQDRVMTILLEEWQAADEQVTHTRSRSWIGKAAVVLTVVAALGWGASQTRRASVVAADAQSYSRLLTSLGGKEFRIGELRSRSGHTVFDGSVVLYDSDKGQSWGIVVVRAPGVTGEAAVTLSADDGRTIDMGTLKFQTDGDAATWLVTSSDLTPFTQVTITAEDGTTLAAADIALA